MICDYDENTSNVKETNASMQYSRLSGIKIPISDIIFGCCNPIIMNDTKDSDELLDVAYSNGFNVFDTAKVYDDSEKVLGRWIKNSSIREKVVIITKGCHPDPNPRLNTVSLEEDIQTSLRRLQTDYIDIYLLHRDDPNADILGILLKLNEYIRQGIITKIGVSNWSHSRIEKANRLAEEHGLVGFTVSSPQMSLARQVKDPWCGCISISYDEDACNWYSSHPEVTVFAYSCLGRGMFSGKVNTKQLWRSKRRLDSAARQGYWSKENINRLRNAENIASNKECTVAQVALAWLRSHEFQVFPIATMSSDKRIKENIEGLSVNLSDLDLMGLKV